MARLLRLRHHDTGPRRGAHWSVLLAAFALALPMAATAPRDAAAVMRGEPARDPNGTRRSTVLIETPEGICTGAIVGPDLVLTAAHCVSAQGRYRVRYLDRSFRRLALAVTRTAAHPGFDPHHGFASDDVGLLQVARPFGADIRPAGLPAGSWGVSWLAPSASGEELLIAGFGSTERSRARDGVLREALMRTAQPSVSGRGFAGLASEDNQHRPGMCVGDSGGPVYRRSGSGFVVVGVLKGGTTDPGRECTSTPIYVPLRDYVGWIRQKATSWNAVIGTPVEMRQ